MPGQASAIPVGTQFAPSLVDLKAFLQALCSHSGNKDALEEAVWSPPVRTKAVAKKPTRRRASLPLEAAVQYKLLQPVTYVATDLTKDLAKLSGQDLYDTFARHIMLALGGLRVVEAAQQMELDGLEVTADSLAGYLTDQGFPVTVHNTAINSLRMWLAKAGVFPDGKRKGAWKVNSAAKEALVGMDDDTLTALVGLSDDQRAYLEALCRVAPIGWHHAAEIRDLGEMILGRRMDRGNLPKTYLEPLHRAGLIEYDSGGTSSGKTSRLKTTDAFDSEVLTKFVNHTVKDLNAALAAYYVRAPEDIYADLKSDDVNVKGEALEAFAVRVMRLLGLRFVAWRKRAAAETGRAEVDVLMAGLIGGLPTRWQVQCKNKPSGRITLEDVAKEVGLAPITKATHIMLLANCTATQDARDFARETMRHTPLTVVILEKEDFDTIRKVPASLAVVLRREAAKSAKVPRYGVDWLGT